MSEQEQFEAIKKSANSQERTLKRWIGNLTEDEGLIFIRTYKGKPGLVIAQMITEDFLGTVDHILNRIAKDSDIEFGEMLSMLSILHYAKNDNSHSSKSYEED